MYGFSHCFNDTFGADFAVCMAFRQWILNSLNFLNVLYVVEVFMLLFHIIIIISFDWLLGFAILSSFAEWPMIRMVDSVTLFGNYILSAGHGSAQVRSMVWCQDIVLPSWLEEIVNIRVYFTIWEYFSRVCIYWMTGWKVVLCFTFTPL